MVSKNKKESLLCYVTIIFVPIRPSRRNEELDELEETEEQ